MKRNFMKKIVKYVGQSLMEEIQYSVRKGNSLYFDDKKRLAQNHLIPEGKIDLVDFGRIKAFMYMDDLIYDNFVSEPAKHYDLKRILKEGLSPYQPKELSKADSTNVVEIVARHYTSNGLDFTFIDVGCNNAAETLAIADFFSNEGVPAKIIAFDPGRAGNLVEYTIRLNGFTDRVRFEPVAVSCHCLPTIMRIQVGHSEDNRIVNVFGNRAEDVYYRIVDTTTIDEYCNNHEIKSHLIVKTDTQGGDYDVIMGMKKMLNERIVTFITEFAPSLVASSVNPIDFLNQIDGTHHLINLGWYRFRKSDIKQLCSENFVRFIDELINSNDWTDILAIPRTLPEVNKLLEKFRSNNRCS